MSETDNDTGAGGAHPTRSVSAREVRVYGQVQGVFFRATCVDQARQAGVVGWVRNEADGTVSAHFEGAATDVESMVAWCREGSSRAEVSGVEATAVQPAGFTDFDQRG